MEEEGTPADDDERPPICPACGVTMGMVVDEGGATRYVCLECGFSDERGSGFGDRLAPPEPSSP